MAKNLINIPVSRFAKYLYSNPQPRKRILREIKKPKTSGFRGFFYYLEAKNALTSFYKNKYDTGFLQDKINQFLLDAVKSNKGRKTRLKYNAKVLNQYLQFFSNINYEVLPAVKFSIQYGLVNIKATPDLHVIENGKKKIIKFGFPKDITQKEIKVITNTFFEAQRKAGLNYDRKCIVYLDIPRGKVIYGDTFGSAMEKNIQIACKNIPKIYSQI